ncbi:hypothetical protein ACFFQW_17075 [Umezawaea endophytica]|uniref:Uncharacterized protein n=1 Tax=Umezawaea endophytica TaxID=1654476 RepID=A0A9X3AIE3_9PSEU|nr:hypothetical protein [Umezawaea endophytica]MCS7480465.1 hypothetical protein [Umezawaea endophytica]
MNTGISFDFASTVTWARTMPVPVSSAEQMGLAAVIEAGAAQGFAVHGDDVAVSVWVGRWWLSSAGGEPVGEDGGQQIGVEAGQQPPHRRAGGDAIEAKPVTGMAVEIVDPVGDRRE